MAQLHYWSRSYVSAEQLILIFDMHFKNDMSTCRMLISEINKYVSEGQIAFRFHLPTYFRFYKLFQKGLIEAQRQGQARGYSEGVVHPFFVWLPWQMAHTVRYPPVYHESRGWFMRATQLSSDSPFSKTHTQIIVFNVSVYSEEESKR